jgi:hypothetical protein
MMIGEWTDHRLTQMTILLGDECNKDLDTFVESALRDESDGSKIYCPCMKCHNRYLYSTIKVKQHYQMLDFMRGIKNGVFMGKLTCVLIIEIITFLHLKTYTGSI